MAKFDNENQGNFGIPGVSIEPSLSSDFDPYSGIDLRNISSCDYIEVMTLPSGVSSEEVYCDDPFAATGPAWHGGTGEPGVCKNFGQINVRHLGVFSIDGVAQHPASPAHNSWPDNGSLWFWGWIAGNIGADGAPAGWTARDIPAGEIDKWMAHDRWYYGTMGPAWWGYLDPLGNKIEGDPTEDKYINQFSNYVAFYTMSHLGFGPIHTNVTPPQFQSADHDLNLVEMKLYWTPNDDDFTVGYDFDEDPGEIFRFGLSGDDWFSLYMDDGCGGDLQLGNGGEHEEMTVGDPQSGPGSFEGHHIGTYYNDSPYNPCNGGCGDYSYSIFDKTIHKFCPNGDRRLYRIMARVMEETGGYAFSTGYQSPRGKVENGGVWETYYLISGYKNNGIGGGATSNAPGVHNIVATFVNPTSVDENGLQDDSNGDGQYYRTDGPPEEQTKYYEGSDTVEGLDIPLTQEEVRDYVRNINCNTVIDTKISDFNRMRAVCRDGSYVEMANNGDSINNILDPSPVEVEIEYQSPNADTITSTYQLKSNSDARLYKTHEIPNVAPLLEGIYEIKVTSVRLSGDFDSTTEKVYTGIAGLNLGALRTGEQGPTIYEMIDSTQYIDKNFVGNWMIGSGGGTDSGVNAAVYIEGTSLFIPMYFNASSEVDVRVSHTGNDFTFEIDFEIVLGDTATLTITQGYEDYKFITGREACDSITYFNSDLYYLSDSDYRPSLGLFATIDNNVTSNFFESNLMDELFTQVNKKQFVQNGDGRYVEQNNYYSDVSGYTAETEAVSTFIDSYYKPQGGWQYVSFDGAVLNLTEGNKPGGDNYPNGNYSKKFLQHPLNEDIFYEPGKNSYAGAYPYIAGINESQDNGEFQRLESLNHPLQWAKWIESYECYSYNRCLKFQADDRWDDVESMANYAVSDMHDGGYLDNNADTTPHLGNLQLVNNNEYRTINQTQKFYSSNDTSINPYSSLEVSFWMKTMDDVIYDISNPPHVQVSVTRGGDPYHIASQILVPYGEAQDAFTDVYLDSGNWITVNEPWYFPNNNYSDQTGTYNSITSDSSDYYNNFGTANVFKNSLTNTWEKFTFTFNLFNSHNRSDFDIKNLYLIAQATSTIKDRGFRGTVLLDNMEVKESYEFRPDCDVRKKISAGVYGIGDLTQYYDPTIPEQLEAFNDTLAPLEVQFYFYPRYHYEEFFNKSRQVIYNDFRQGMFYIHSIDWGDGSPKEFVSEPQKINEDTAIYHTYETAGIFEITGTMLRMKPNKDYEPIGVIHNERFVLRININEGSDEDFTYFGSEGFSFIPYKNTLPIVGGYSEQSMYYKSISRTLGILEEGNIINTNFESVGDRLKTEVALEKMDSNASVPFILLNAFKEERFDLEGNTVYTGMETYKDELGKSLGDLDISCVRYFNEPKQIWDMFGFEEVEELSDFITSDEYLVTLPFPDYFEEFNIVEQGSGILDDFDIDKWTELGRPDIAEYIAYAINEGESIDSIYAESEPGGEGGSTPQPRPFVEFYNLNATPNQNHYGLLSSPRYWKRIIDEEMIFDRDGLYYENGRTDLINENSNQDWNNLSYYYPALPKYGADGKFQKDIYPFRLGNPKIPFPLEGPITDESYTTPSLKISINSEMVDSNIINDDSGNKNYAFVINDFKPKFSNTTLKPNKNKNVSLIKTSTKGGAF